MSRRSILPVADHRRMSPSLLPRKRRHRHSRLEATRLQPSCMGGATLRFGRLSPSVELMVDPESGARYVIRGDGGRALLRITGFTTPLFVLGQIDEANSVEYGGRLLPDMARGRRPL
jgi:hypothetical protein